MVPLQQSGYGSLRPAWASAPPLLVPVLSAIPLPAVFREDSLRRIVWFVAAFALAQPCLASGLTLSPNDTLEMPGLSVIVHQNLFHPVFKDEKNGGIQIVLHGDRIATDGEVRLSPTPEQWDPVPTLVSRRHGSMPNQLIVSSSYDDIHFTYKLEVTAEGSGFRVAVDLDKPLPAALAAKAGFNLDFLPSAYFGKTYFMGDATGLFPRHPNGPMAKDGDPKPLATGKSIVLAPEDKLTAVSITSDAAPLMLFDARDRAQNGWFVVRALIPAGATKNALVWHIRPHVIPNWVRPPAVSYNQLGYTPSRSKVAVIELDPRFKAPATASVLKLDANGKSRVAFQGKIKFWGKWLRYNYARFDFSALKQPGLYTISYAGRTTTPFRIAADAYVRSWQPTLDTYLVVEMDHVAVREGYRVWHGPSHLDDARQAPADHVHFDGYAMGPNLDSPFPAGAHIPGLNVGGWFDAGDYDIRSQSQAQVIMALSQARETFGLDWDETTVDEAGRSVTIRKPDGIPDVLEQVKHGTLQLLAQYRIFGHAIPGIIEPTLQEYTHLGDAASKTDRMIYDPAMAPLQNDGIHSGVPDDRWAFTTHTTALNYVSAAALAAAARVLKDSDPALAQEALAAAATLWETERKSAPVASGNFNTTGGDPQVQEVVATVELVLASKGAAPYSAHLKELLPVIRENFAFTGWQAARALPYMDADFRSALARMLKAELPVLDAELRKTPFGVPVSLGTWAGAHFVAAFAVQSYVFHKAFPELVGPQHTLDAFDYLLGRHPDNALSLVSTVGTQSKLMAYGNNRADYTFIPGGVVPGVLVVKPDFPELKKDWPFLWYENEYVIDTASTYILAANAALELSK
jgi:endoglucanase